VYNIGGGNEWRNINLVNLICKVLAEITEKPEEEYKKLITFVKDRPGHDRRYALSIEKMQREFGWEPLTEFKKNLVNTVTWYLNNLDWIKELTNSLG
jgi:dTDP-glucose 4,6-dehydratase